ncbi:MAG: DoxX family protein [Ilumatobacteraceae bacterium]
MQTHRSKKSASKSSSRPADTDATAADSTGWLSASLAHRRARTVAAVLTGVCGVVALVSATAKLTNQAAVVELLDRVEVHGLLRDLLPFIQIAGGVGALGSLIRFARLGVAALAGLALYFTGAVIAHLRVGDGIGDIAVPIEYVIVMSATAALRRATLDNDA